MAYVEAEEVTRYTGSSAIGTVDVGDSYMLAFLGLAPQKWVNPEVYSDDIRILIPTPSKVSQGVTM